MITSIFGNTAIPRMFTRSCICSRLAMLVHQTELHTKTAEFSRAWLNISNSYLGIIATLPVLPQPSPCLSTPLSPLPSPLVSRPKRGSKNSGELNSHNNMRLSGDRGSNVCAGQHEGSDCRLLKSTAMTTTAGTCSCVRSLFLHCATLGRCRIFTFRLDKEAFEERELKADELRSENFPDCGWW